MFFRFLGLIIEFYYTNIITNYIDFLTNFLYIKHMDSDEIKQLRKRLGWSQADFGRYFGVTSQAVLKWEHGETQPSDFAVAAMIQLRRRLDALGEQQKQQFINGLKNALLTGGIIALLAYLFNNED